MATKAKQAKPAEKRMYQVPPIGNVAYAYDRHEEDDVAARLRRIEGKLLYMSDLERDRRYEEEMKNVVAKERSKANAQYWIGLLTGVVYGVALTITWFKKNRIGAIHRETY